MNYLGIDVGGTAIKYAIMDENANFLKKGEMPTPMDSLDSYLTALDGIIKKYAGLISGIAMCVPGIIDHVNGICITGGNLKYVSNLPLVSLLEKKYGIPVTIDNDAKSAALAEVWQGAMKSRRDGIIIIIGSALGGALIQNRKLYRGRHLSAGEFSFICMGDDMRDIDNFAGNMCGVNHLIQIVSEKTGINKKELNGIRVFQLAKEGNEKVLDAINDYTKNLAKIIYNLQVIYDPEVFAIGGGISQQPILLELLIRNINDIYEHLPFSAGEKMEVVQCRFLNECNLIGALYGHLLKKTEMVAGS